MKQRSLFDDPEPRSPSDDAETRALASRLPRELRLGTSSWSFPGWRGTVWPDAPGWTEARCAREGLAIYAKHPLFRAVGIDRSYYGPLREDELRAHATKLPSDFRAVSKVWSELVKSPGKNPRWLSPEAFLEEQVAAYRDAFAAHAGPFVLEVPPNEPIAAPALHAFLNAVRDRLAPFTMAIEIRAAHLLDAALGRAIASSGASFCFTFHPTMPNIAEQVAWAARHGLLESGPPLVARLMLPPGETYETRRRACLPFDRLIDVQEGMRRQVVDLVARAVRCGREIFVLVNNKAEGSAPLTVRALAERLAAG